MAPWGEIAAAGGQTANNRLNQLIDVINFAKSIGDEQAMQKAIAEFRALPNIDPKALQYVADLVGVEPDVLAGNQRQDQIGALRQMQNVANKGGLDDAAIAANQQSGMQAARSHQADNAAISGSLARRGLQAGSGAELAMRQSSAQQAYNTRAMEGAQNAASAQMRALQAIQSSGRLAGDIASDEEQRMAQNAERRLATDRFNSSVKNAASQFNSGMTLNAANYNRGLAMDKINPDRGAKQGLRDEQKGYVEDFGNREQLEGEQLGSMFGMDSMMPFGKGGKK